MMTRNVTLTILIILTTLFLSNIVFSQEDSKNNELSEKEKIKHNIELSGELKLIDKSGPEKVKDKWKISGWVGYNSYKMGIFNKKLSGEGNKKIDNGLNMGLEVVPSSFKLNLAKLIGISSIESDSVPIKLPTSFPLGFEYLEAKSRTIHGGDITVNWELPVTGFYISPEIDVSELFEKQKEEKRKNDEGLRLKLRPLGVGYYRLGKLMDAKLTLTGEPGHLKASSEAIGISVLSKLEYREDDFEIYVEGGYRWLEFTDVLREPKGGFAGNAAASALPETLDYSGFIIRGGIAWRY